ncbi:hypothetical protein GCM10009527_091770 [Actinomadura nitritigenes]
MLKPFFVPEPQKLKQIRTWAFFTRTSPVARPGHLAPPLSRHGPEAPPFAAALGALAAAAGRAVSASAADSAAPPARTAATADMTVIERFIMITFDSRRLLAERA